MKSEWITQRLSEIVDFNPRESLPKGGRAKKIPMDALQPYCRDIPTYEVTEFNGGTKFRNGDTIMARITPCLENGKTAQVNILGNDEIGFGSTEFIVFRAKKGISDPDYIYYLVSSPLVRDPSIKSMVGSSGRQRVQTDVVQGLQVPLPPLEEQRKIAGILRTLDDKIKLNTEINKNLLNQVLALYNHIFIDRDISKCVCRADEFFDITIGKTPPRKEHQWFSKIKKNITWISISDMGNSELYLTDSSEYLTPEAVKKFHVSVVPDDTVLLSFKLTVGRIGITDGAMTSNEAIAHFKTLDHKINPYLYCYLTNFNFQSLGNTPNFLGR